MKKSDTNLYKVSVQYTVSATKEIRVPKEFKDSRRLRVLLQIFCQENFDLEDYEILGINLDDYATEINDIYESHNIHSSSNELLTFKCNPKDLMTLSPDSEFANYDPYHLFDNEINIKKR